MTSFSGIVTLSAALTRSRLVAGWLLLLAWSCPAAEVLDQAERQLGYAVREAMRYQYGFLDDPLLTHWVDGVGQRLAANVPRQDYPYLFAVVDTDAINAFAAPGCLIFVTKGLLQAVANDDELAAVLAHELGHASEKHGRLILDRELIWLAGQELAEPHLPGLVQLGLQVVHVMDTLGFSRHLENRADRFGVEWAYRAGYDPRALLAFFDQIAPGRRPSDFSTYFRTHPAVHERQARVSQMSWCSRESLGMVLSVADGLAARLRLRPAAELYRRALDLHPNSRHAADQLASLAARRATDAAPLEPDPASQAAANRLRLSAAEAGQRQQELSPRLKQRRRALEEVWRRRSDSWYLDRLLYLTPKPTDWQWYVALGHARDNVVKLDRGLRRAFSCHSAASDLLNQLRALAHAGVDLAARGASAAELDELADRLGAVSAALADDLDQAMLATDQAAKAIGGGYQLLELVLLGILDPGNVSRVRFDTATFASLEAANAAVGTRAREGLAAANRSLQVLSPPRLEILALAMRSTLAGRPDEAHLLAAEVLALRLGRPVSQVLMLAEARGGRVDEAAWLLAAAGSRQVAVGTALEFGREAADAPAAALDLGADSEALRLVLTMLRRHWQDTLD